MDNKTICKKIASMLSLYIDNRVTYQERAFIEEHISNCEECYKKYIYLKSLIKDLKDFTATFFQKKEAFNVLNPKSWTN